MENVVKNDHHPFLCHTVIVSTAEPFAVRKYVHKPAILVYMSVDIKMAKLALKKFLRPAGALCPTKERYIAVRLRHADSCQ